MSYIDKDAMFKMMGKLADTNNQLIFFLESIDKNDKSELVELVRDAHSKIEPLIDHLENRVFD